jgi:carbon monoxide dehydrogenase subunit G
VFIIKDGSHYLNRQRPTVLKILERERPAVVELCMPSLPSVERTNPLYWSADIAPGNRLNNGDLVCTDCE